MEMWRERLAAARADYEDAAIALSKATAEGTGILPAQERVLAARAAYLNVLKIFTDIVLGARKPSVS